MARHTVLHCTVQFSNLIVMFFECPNARRKLTASIVQHLTVIFRLHIVTSRNLPGGKPDCRAEFVWDGCCCERCKVFDRRSSVFDDEQDTRPVAAPASMHGCQPVLPIGRGQNACQFGSGRRGLRPGPTAPHCNTVRYSNPSVLSAVFMSIQNSARCFTVRYLAVHSHVLLVSAVRAGCAASCWCTNCRVELEHSTAL